MMQYIDAELESRTGLSKQAQGIDGRRIAKSIRHAVAQVFSASQMRIKLLARIMAEGVRDIFALLHARSGSTASSSTRFACATRGSISIRGLETRDHLTINVGLGTGGKRSNSRRPWRSRTSRNNCWRRQGQSGRRRAAL